MILKIKQGWKHSSRKLKTIKRKINLLKNKLSQLLLPLLKKDLGVKVPLNKVLKHFVINHLGLAECTII